jgi:hypothetical protein
MSISYYLKFFLFFVLFVGSSTWVKSATLIYSAQAYINGSLGGSSFTNRLATISQTADIANITRVGSSSQTYVNIGTVVLNISGFQEAVFTGSDFAVFSTIEPEYFPIYGTYGSVGFGVVNGGATLWGISPFFGSFRDSLPLYDLSTPTTLRYAGGINSLASWQTTLGSFSLVQAPYGYIGDVVFSATAVPEPSTYALFGIGAIGLLMVMRRKCFC